MAERLPPIQKAKGVLVNSRGELLTLIRSELEDTRAGGRDLPGGKFDEEERDARGTVIKPAEVNPQAVFIREAGEELPGTKIVESTIVPLDIDRKQKAGRWIITYTFGANAEFPEHGIEISPEHTGGDWLAEQDLLELEDMPGKYQAAVAKSGLIIARLAELAPEHAPPVIGQAEAPRELTIAA